MIATWVEQLRRLSLREQLLVGGGIVFLVVALFYVMVLEPILDRMQRLDRLIAGKQSQVEELAVIRAEYGGVHAKALDIDNAIDAIAENFSLLAFLEEVADRGRIKSNIVSMRPQSALPSSEYREHSVEVKVERVTLPAVVHFLKTMHESPAVLRFKRFHIRPRFDDQEFLDVSFLVSTYERQ